MRHRKPMMQPPKPPKPSVPPPAPVPKSLPPPAPIPTASPLAKAGAAPSSLPPPKPASIPPARPAPAAVAPISVPPPARVPSSLPPAQPPVAQAPPASVPPAAAQPAAPQPAPLAAQAAASPAREQFYVKEGEDVRTLGLEQIRLEVSGGGLGPETLVCKVGDSEWLALADAGALGIPLNDLDSVTVTNVNEDELVMEEEENPFAKKKSLGSGVLTRLLGGGNKGTKIVWAAAGALALLVILQRNGGLLAVADFIGQAESYESLEKDLLGGPGAGTVRTAKSLWASEIEEEAFPFSRVEKKVSGTGAEESPSEE